ncbi:DnaJ heat shock protein family (Hsp40) member C17 [Phyllostomus discolor]|uniref:DnaJ heat shock protein family (Hsp40) member C17 n=1 Tax=Phyllostomus discolor TaxID=89673 RepID=A0A834BHF7_9CHIR|nr:DnaJ heat shock protein family (Hsp40) member C17 [Phyllostomus discolor]
MGQTVATPEMSSCGFFRRYGEVLNLVLSRKKAGTAVVEFATVKAAELAVQNEVGLVDNPLKISWLEGRPQGRDGPRHPGLAQVRNQASHRWACSGFRGPFPVWAPSSQIQVIPMESGWQICQPEQEDHDSVLTLSSAKASGPHHTQSSQTSSHIPVACWGPSSATTGVLALRLLGFSVKHLAPRQPSAVPWGRGRGREQLLLSPTHFPGVSVAARTGPTEQRRCSLLRSNTSLPADSRALVAWAPDSR